jgi:hypothetical protein
MEVGAFFSNVCSITWALRWFVKNQANSARNNIGFFILLNYSILAKIVDFIIDRLGELSFYCQFASGKNFILIPEPYDVESGHQAFLLDFYFAGCNIGY